MDILQTIQPDQQRALLLSEGLENPIWSKNLSLSLQSLKGAKM